MAEFNIQHRRRNSDCSDVSFASVRSRDHPPAFKRQGNQPVGKRSGHDAILINPGPPAIYQLKTERKYIDETDSNVMQWTYGQRDKNKQNKVILLVGETGAGKTTMINTMVNYLMEVKFEDEKFYQITEEEKHEDQTQPQTSEITVYEVFVKENPISLTIIDTPGYKQTGGFTRERGISDDLGKLFSAGIQHIDAVCFVMKESQNILSRKEHYIFHSVLSLYGRDLEDNIVFIITHSNGGPPMEALNAINTAKIQCRRDERENPVHFLFNNQQKEKRAHAYKSSWEMGEKSMEKFLKLLLENNRESLQVELDVPIKRKQLEAYAFNLMDRIIEKEYKIRELNEILVAIGQNRDKIEKSENFVFRVNKTVKEKVYITNESKWNRNSTCCSVCEENCHQFGCWWVKLNDLSGCDVMKYDYCVVCTRKCHHRYHIKQDRKYVIDKRAEIMSFDDLKQKYKYKFLADQFETSFGKTKHKDDSKKEHEQDKKNSYKTRIEEYLNSDLKNIKREKLILLHEACIIIKSLSEIPVRADWYFTPEHLDFFIPRLEEEGEDEKVKHMKGVKKYLEKEKNKLSQSWMKWAESHMLSWAGL